MNASLDDNYNYSDLYMAPPTIITIRNPALCLFAILGAMFGLFVSLLDNQLRLWLLWRRPQQRNQTHHQRLYWSMAYLFFGLMNVAAIPLHCILPMKHEAFDDDIQQDHRIPLPHQYPTWWMMDTGCTGIFSTLLIVALYTSRSSSSYGNGGDDDGIRSSNTWNQYQYVLCILLFACTAAYRFLIHDSSIELELWYSLPVLSAALSFAHELMHHHQHHSLLKKSRALSYYYVIAIALLFGGILIDASSCRWIEQTLNHHPRSKNIRLSWWWDLTRLPAIAFGACDLVFLGLYHHLHTCFSSSISSADGKSKKEKNI
jgi:uncharacterized BrkB/YihY/UPF0761 family membrane protein